LDRDVPIELNAVTRENGHLWQQYVTFAYAEKNENPALAKAANSRGLLCYYSAGYRYEQSGGEGEHDSGCDAV